MSTEDPVSTETRDPEQLVRMSSNWTIMLKLFIPVFWLSFFVPGCLVLLFSESFYQLQRASILSFVVFGIVITGILFFYFTTWRLMRVDMNEKEIYVSNYFKTIKFPYSNLERVTENNLLLFHIFSLRLRAKGILGKKLHFMESGKSFREFVAQHPELFADAAGDQIK